MATSKKVTKSAPAQPKGNDSVSTPKAVETSRTEVAESAPAPAPDPAPVAPELPTPPALLSEPNAAQLLAAQAELMLDPKNTVANAADCHLPSR